MKALSFLGPAACAVAAIAFIWPAQAGAAPLGAVETATVSAQPSTDCHPSYDPCVPNTGNVNCADLRGPVRVHGSDVYRLDRNGNGIGCEESEK